MTSFLPARLFAAGELREGRLGLWNPFLLEGAAQAPAVYPADLLLAAWPSPVFASWLLTLHLPLAALAAFALARALGASPAGAFVSGATYALGGLAMSCLDRAAPLPALALAPLVVLLLRGAALHGSRAVLGAALLLAVALSTLAASIVLPAIVLGTLLALAADPAAAALRRVAAALALGTGLAGVPLALGHQMKYHLPSELSRCVA